MKTLKKILKWISQPRDTSMERYLESSTDIYELEYRQRQLGRGYSRNQYGSFY